jgi:hypothetical protein
MSVHHDVARARWIVRWREDGRQKAKRFTDEDAARQFDAIVAPPPAEPAAGREHVVPAPVGSADRGGVYAYETAEGRRWRFV